MKAGSDVRHAQLQVYRNVDRLSGRGHDVEFARSLARYASAVREQTRREVLHAVERMEEW